MTTLAMQQQQKLTQTDMSWPHPPHDRHCNSKRHSMIKSRSLRENQEGKKNGKSNMAHSP
jgi:hypothetical protein